MFPLRWNFPFRKKDGSMTTVDEALGGGTYELPPATYETLGGIKVGSGLSIAEGVLSVTSSGGGGHCYFVTTNLSNFKQMILFTAYGGEINSADTLFGAFESSGNFNGIAFPYAEHIVKSGRIVAHMRASGTMLYAEAVEINSGLFQVNAFHANKSDFTSVSSTKIW